MEQDKIIIYRDVNDKVDLKVHFQGENVWLTQGQIADLFEKDRTVITKHINNIFKDNEIDEDTNVQKIHITNSDKPVKFYGLDTILAVGYRTNSANAIQFRIWATSVLKEYVIQGYAINRKRLQEAQYKFLELQNVIKLLSEQVKKPVLKGREDEILNLIQNYSKSLTLLEQFDKRNVSRVKGKKAGFILKYTEVKNFIASIKKELIRKKEATDIFGQEKEGTLAGVVGNIYQSFNGKTLYPNIQSKASHLLYFIIKDHPFIDGNKRIASLLFIYFLDKNSFLYKENGERKINDNALITLVLLIAESDPKDKEIFVKLVMNLIT